MVNNLAPAPTGRLPVTRPLAAASFVLPVLLAAVIGLAIAVDLRLTVALCVGAIAAAAMLIRLEWAALLVVGAAVFEDYLAVASPWAAKGLALVLVGSWVVRRGWRRLHEGTRSPVLTVALAFFVAILLATVVHNNGSVGMAVVGRYVGFLAVLAVLVDTMRGGLAPSRVARVYVASCAVAAVCGILTFAFALDRRVGGPVADPNDFAFFLVAAIPLAVALRVGARRPWAYDLAAGLMLVAALGTLSRGALVGLATMVVVATVTRVVSLRAVAIGAVGAATLVAVAVGAFPDLVDVSLHQKSVVADQNVSERIGLWRAAGEMTLENPVTGLGPGSFSLFHQDYRDRLPDDVTHKLDVAHNTYLEISAELGLVGLAVWLALLVTAAISAWARWSRDHHHVAAGVFVAVFGAGASAVFVTEQYFLPLWLLVALGGALLHPPPSTATLLRPQRSL